MKSPSWYPCPATYSPIRTNPINHSVIGFGHVRVESIFLGFALNPLGVVFLVIILVLVLVVFLVFRVVVEFLVGFASVGRIIVEVVKVDIFGVTVIPEIVIDGFFDLGLGRLMSRLSYG